MALPSSHRVLFCLLACLLSGTNTLSIVGVESEDFLPFWSSMEIVHQLRHLLSPDPMLGPVVGAKHIHVPEG